MEIRTPHGARGLQGLQAGVGGAARQGRGDAGEVEPVGALEDLAPREVARLHQGRGAAGAVVDHLRRPLVGAGLQEVDPGPVAGQADPAHVHSVAAQGAQGRLADGVPGQRGDEGRAQAEQGQGRGHVGFAAAEPGLQPGRLEQSLMAWRLEPQHDFAECNNSLHGHPLKVHPPLDT